MKTDHGENRGLLSDLLWEPAVPVPSISYTPTIKPCKILQDINFTTCRISSDFLTISNPKAKKLNTPRKSSSNSIKRKIHPLNTIPVSINILSLMKSKKIKKQETVDVMLFDPYNTGEMYERWEIKCRPRSFVYERIAKILSILNDIKLRNEELRFLCINRTPLNNYVTEKKSILVDLNANRPLLKTYPGKKSFRIIVSVLEICKETLETNTFITKRGLFYRNVNLFKNQSTSDRYIDLIALNFGSLKCCLGIKASQKSLICGDISFNLKDRKTLHCRSGRTGILLPDIKDVVSFSFEARFILVIEKKTIFEELVNTNFMENFNPCVLITGSGYPDISTRTLISTLSEANDIPIFVLTDMDPYGVDIYLCYKYGSKKMEFNSKINCKSMKWLNVSFGLCSPHSGINETNLLPLVKSDWAKIGSIIKLRYNVLHNELEIRRALQLLALSTYKYELEACIEPKPSSKVFSVLSDQIKIFRAEGVPVKDLVYF